MEKEDVNSLVRRIEKTSLVVEIGDLVYPDNNDFLDGYLSLYSY